MIILHIIKTRGQTAIVGVLIIIAIILLIAISVGSSGTRDLVTSGNESMNKKTMYLADSCLEETMIQIKKDAGYSGGTLELFNGICTISITAQDTSKTILVAASIDDYTRKLEAVVRLIDGKLTLKSWRELVE